MKIQKSFEEDNTGVLYVVPTPIGNLDDITIRALNILKQVSIIAAEDTRNTKKLLHHFDINVPLISYHEHNKISRENQLLHRLDNGESIALVSDAGMPAISDPGYEIVKSAIDHGRKVVTLPGANAALCALVGSGILANEFYFYGFLPRKKKDKVRELNRIKNYTATLLFYESPYRVRDTLQVMKEVFGERSVVAARELTKRFEEYARGTFSELIEWFKENEPKGEFCLVVEGNLMPQEAEESTWWEELSIMEHVDYYTRERDLTNKEAVKQVAVDRNMPKREVYQAYHIQK